MATKSKGGRPRHKPYTGHFKALGKVPTHDSLAVFEWVQRALALDAARIVKTKGVREQVDKRLAQELQRTAKCVKELTDAVLIAEAFDPELLRELDPDKPPPKDQVKTAAWYLLVLARYLQDLVNGRVDEVLGTALRTNLKAWAAVLPPSARIEAMQKLKDEQGSVAGNGPRVEKTPRSKRQPLKLVR